MLYGVLTHAKLKQFNTVVDSLGILKDTVTAVALGKLNYLKTIYAGTGHVEIQQKLSDLNIRAFQSITYSFPNGCIACYENENLPVVQRKSCIKFLVDEYGRSSNFTKVVQLEKEFLKHFGAPDRNADHYFISEVDSTKKYISQIEDLQKKGLSKDSLFYFNTLALETICQTHWYCSEGCGGCDYTILTDKLKNLPVHYPQSSLCDNAALRLLEIYYLYGYGGDEVLMAQSNDYEKFLTNYPDSDLKADVEFRIFQNWTNMQTLNTRKVNSTAQRFIHDFGADKRVAAVKKQLGTLNSN